MFDWFNKSAIIITVTAVIIFVVAIMSQLENVQTGMVVV